MPDLSTPTFSKGENTVQFRQCRFPTFHTQEADSDETENIITLITEYYDSDASKAGFLRIYLKSDYTESVV